MADALYGGRWFRTLNVIDEGNRHALGIVVATSIPSAWELRRYIDDRERAFPPGWPRYTRIC
jgi:hypothetical protein